MRLAVPDLISNSGFPPISAVELGDFAEQGLEVTHEPIIPVDHSYQALRDGVIDLVGGSAHAVLSAFPARMGANWPGLQENVIVDKTRPRVECRTRGARPWQSPSTVRGSIRRFRQSRAP